MRTISIEQFHDEPFAGTGLAELDDAVTIMKEGVPIARLRPLSSHPKPDPQLAINALREFRQRERLTLGVSFREAREAGRM